MTVRKNDLHLLHVIPVGDDAAEWVLQGQDALALGLVSHV
ncbi:hypothetical protein FQN60_018345, partial [Etheostoma spectabile]